MDDTGSQPPLCPCGFWGSPQTLNLCSKCYKDELQRKGKLEDKGKAVSVDSNVDSSKPTKSSDFKDTSTTGQDKKSDNEAKNSQSVGSESGLATECNTAYKTIGSETRLESLSDCTEKASQDSTDSMKDRPTQKNRKRCWTCKAKLELAQRELGNCKCSYVFCQLHRLPEQHSCVFDHKESGRREAREKMVSPGPRKVGRSFQRMDE